MTAGRSSASSGAGSGSGGSGAGSSKSSGNTGTKHKRGSHVAMSEYDRVRARCLKRNELWEDPDFPAVQASVFYHETPPFKFQWKRPTELYKDAVFINDLPDKFAVSPGKLGDAWFVSCLGSLFMCKGLFYRVVPADQSFDDIDAHRIINDPIYDELDDDETQASVDDGVGDFNDDDVLARSKRSSNASCSGSSSNASSTIGTKNKPGTLTTPGGGSSSSTGKAGNDATDVGGKLRRRNDVSPGYSGVFRFRIWWCGNWEEVLVDDRLPTVGNKLVFIHSTTSGKEMWSSLLEKAYAKLHGSYEALKYGTALDGLADLTGGAAENLKLSQVGSLMNVSKIGINAGAVVPATAQLVAHLLGMTSVVTAVVEQDPNVAKGHQETLPNGIIVGVNYRVCTVQKVEKYDGDFVQLVLLALPSVPEDTGQTQHMNNNLDYDILYDGLWSRGSTTWNDVPTEEQERIGLGALAPEEFWMSLPDFVKTFTHLEMVHLDHETSKDEETLNGCRAWQMRSHHAVWQKGVTAGGCRNNTETFHLNPQMLLGVAERQEVVVSVSQHAILEPKVVGFSLYRLTNSNQTDDSVPHQKYVACTRDYFRRHKSFFNSEYTNSRQVSARVVLEAGHYVILPTTFEPGEEASFTLRVYSAKLFKLRVLDTPSALVKPIIVKAPAMMNGGTFSQYEAVFLQLADEHMTVNAFELQELLDACLPNDYVKSCASLDVCRQVVIALDRDGRGRLKFADFKDFLVSLKSWQGAFRAHTKEKMGILRAERLKDALQHVGYQLSREILSVIAMRYTRKDGTLRFGDFVSAVLKLSMAFGLFERRQLTQPNTLNITQDEWLKMVLMC